MATLNLEVPPAYARGRASAWLKPLDEDRERERRAHERVMAHELEWLKSIRLKFGPLLSIIDLSAGGALFETNAPLRPGSTSSLTITGRGVIETATFRVLRCQVASLDGGLVYRGACVFERQISLPEAPRPVGWGTSLRVGEGTGPSTTGSNELDEVLRLIRAAAARPGTGTLGRPVAALLADVGVALRRGDAPDDVLSLIERQLGSELSRIANAPRSSVVEVPRIDPIHREPMAPAASRLPTPESMGSGSGWNKIVVRYLDGRMLKGFSQDFHPSRPHFHLSPTIGGVTHPPVLVPMPRLKAVFFVREFEGDPDYVDRRSFVEPLPGRRIEVTFLDDEVMMGATLGYRPDGTGFFVTPADPNSNNLRIFVLPGAIRHIRYL
jgi:hypothetical protein